MNLKAFFVDAFAAALETGVATTDDILRHATPDVLSVHLPRPLWARLIAACLGAPRVDSKLVVETIGLPNLAEHIPGTILWACILEFGNRAFGAEWKPAAPVPIATPVVKSAPLATPPPPEELAKPAAVASPAPSRTAHPTIPTPELIEVEDAPAAPTVANSAAPRSRPPVQQRFRQSSTGIGRLAPTNNAVATRKPQATTTSVSAPPAPPARRANTDAEDDVMTEVGGKDDWKNALAVEDEQLVDWTASDEGTNVDELGRRK